MEHFQLLKSLAKHARESDFDALYIVSWLAGSMTTEELQRLLDAVHEGNVPNGSDTGLTLVAERFGRAPGDTR